MTCLKRFEYTPVVKPVYTHNQCHKQSTLFGDVIVKLFTYFNDVTINIVLKFPSVLQLTCICYVVHKSYICTCPIRIELIH